VSCIFSSVFVSRSSFAVHGIRYLGQNKNKKRGCPFSLFEVHITLECKFEVSASIFAFFHDQKTAVGFS
jgi:hypothetical protein